MSALHKDKLKILLMDCAIVRWRCVPVQISSKKLLDNCGVYLFIKALNHGSLTEYHQTILYKYVVKKMKIIYSLFTLIHMDLYCIVVKWSDIFIFYPQICFCCRPYHCTNHIQAINRYVLFGLLYLLSLFTNKILSGLH